MADSWAWHYERSGQFSVRSAYRLLRETKCRREDWLLHRPGNSNIDENKRQWARLWKLKIPGNLNFFCLAASKEFYTD